MLPGRSSINTKKMIGPITKSRGTPDNTGAGAEKTPSMSLGTVYCDYIDSRPQLHFSLPLVNTVPPS